MMDDKKLRDFFESGFYEEFWGWEFSEKESRETAEKSIQLLEAKEGHILDWCGGWGRISLHLAKKGFTITILDFVEEYLSRAKRIFQDNKLPLMTIRQDCRNTPQHIQADYALCTFNSIGFLSDEDQINAFKSLYGALKKNGKVIIDCINQMFLSRHFIEVTESKRPDGIRCVKKNHFDLLTSVLHSDFQLISDKGDIVNTSQFGQRIYTPLELRKTLELAGFNLLAIYGDFEGNELSFDLPHMVTVVKK